MTTAGRPAPRPAGARRAPRSRSGPERASPRRRRARSGRSALARVRVQHASDAFDPALAIEDDKGRLARMEIPDPKKAGRIPAFLEQCEALVKAADKVIEKAKPIAAHMLEASASDIEYVGGQFQVRGVPGKAVPFGAVERTYRIFVEELPPSTQQAVPPGQVRVLARMGIPIFVEARAGRAELRVGIEAGDVVRPVDRLDGRAARRARGPGPVFAAAVPVRSMPASPRTQPRLACPAPTAASTSAIRPIGAPTPCSTRC